MRGIRVNERLLIITTTETGYTAQGATVTSNDDYIVRFTLDSIVQPTLNTGMKLPVN